MKTMNSLTKLLCVLPLLMPAAASAAPPNQNRERKPDKPNILFIIADDQRWDTIGALGNPDVATPNLDALAKRGFVFRNAYCMGSMIGAVCTPSRTMLLTGRSLWRIPAWDSKTWTQPTLGSIFKDAGYDTLFVGKRGNSFVAAHEAFETVVYDELRTTPMTAPAPASSTPTRPSIGSIIATAIGRFSSTSRRRCRTIRGSRHRSS